jgi:hypothetical protein
VEYPPWLHWTPTRTLYIGEPIEVSNYNTILQTLVALDYAIELYTL